MKTHGGSDSKTATEEHEGLQLAQWLATFDRIQSRNQAKRVIASGKVRLNGSWVGPDEASRRLLAGDEVVIEWNRPGTSKPHAKAQRELLSKGLDILFEDAYVVALNKPPGLLTDSATKQQARERATARKLMGAYLKPQKKRAVVVHRIDRDTSGIVLFAKDPLSAEKIREGFRAQALDRVYWVAVQGGPEEDEGLWEDTVYWDAKWKVLRRALPDQKGAKEASATFKVLERYGKITLLQVTLNTGKRNQIRYQCQERGYPLCGERLYVPKDWEQSGLPCPRQALHAQRLAFDHPQTRKRVVVESPLPEDLNAWLVRAKRAQ